MNSAFRMCNFFKDVTLLQSSPGFVTEFSNAFGSMSFFCHISPYSSQLSQCWRVSRGTFLTVMKKKHSVTNESNIATSARCGHARTNNHKWNLTLIFVNFSFLKNIPLLSRQLTSSVSWLSSLSVLFQKYLRNLKEFYWRNSQLPINPRIHENIFLSVLISSPGESW